ncbi:transporter substrate-binding domain-containing protein [Candidatus Binatia bacterium]|nr:transporter substrate-binding domain-containing protein [Candidatus Binatia bacterium]
MPVAAPLRVGTSGDYPPFSVRASDGTFDGFDVAVARAYGRDRGREVVLVPFAWPDLERRLTAHELDVAMSGVTVRGDRLARAPMTSTVARTSAILLVAASRADVPADGRGLTVAVNRGGHLERVARAHLPRASIRLVDDNRSLPELLSSGRVDGVVTDTLEAATFAPSTASPTRVALMLSRDRKAYWVAPGNEALADDLDTWLAARSADGMLDALRAQFLATSAAPTAELPPASSRVVDLVARRLLLMPEVAAAKAVAGLPIEVPAREAEVLDRARAAGQQAGLAAEPYVAFVREQMDVAKIVQRAVLARRGTGTPPADPAAVAAARARLDGDLRPAIDRLDGQIRDALALNAPLRSGPGELTAALVVDAPVPGFDPAQARRLADALSAIPARLVKRGEEIP